MTKLIYKTDNETVFIECDDGFCVGVDRKGRCFDFGSGLLTEHGTLEVFERHGVELEQDWENEQTFVDLGSSRLVFDAEGVRLVENA